MQVFKVGGCVRDTVMGIEPRDVDWVVVGATPADMLALGYQQVGADFPVFLHPETGDEHALARVERKTGDGYHGFDVVTDNVTIEQDLARRDLTINSMAISIYDQIIDPYGGALDIKNKVLRHTSDAFAEDPVRILRVLRFLARFGHEWTVAPETVELIRMMIARGDADHLVPERVWKELSRALDEQHPHLFIEGMVEWGLTKLECFAAFQDANTAVTQLNRFTRLSIESKFALTFGATGSRTPPTGIPATVWAVALLWDKYRDRNDILVDPKSHPEAIVEFMSTCKMFQQTWLSSQVVDCWEAWHIDTAELRKACYRVLAVDTQAITSSMPPGPAVGAAIKQARINAV